MRKTQNKEERLHFGFTMPKELHARLAKMAIKKRRSLTDQIIYMLEEGLKNPSVC
jgi:hypothetical protein